MEKKLRELERSNKSGETKQVLNVDDLPTLQKLDAPGIKEYEEKCQKLLTTNNGASINRGSFPRDIQSILDIQWKVDSEMSKGGTNWRDTIALPEDKFIGWLKRAFSATGHSSDRMEEAFIQEISTTKIWVDPIDVEPFRT